MNLRRAGGGGGAVMSSARIEDPEVAEIVANIVDPLEVGRILTKGTFGRDTAFARQYRQKIDQAVDVVAEVVLLHRSISQIIDENVESLLREPGAMERLISHRNHIGNELQLWQRGAIDLSM